MILLFSFVHQGSKGVDDWNRNKSSSMEHNQSVPCLEYVCSEKEQEFAKLLGPDIQ